MNRKRTIKIIIFILFLICISFFLPDKSKQDTVWIDVRSPMEYAQNNIKGDLLIPHQQILSQASKLYPDKNTIIRLYCRSGRRAGIAMNILKQEGYENVFNAGGIDDVRLERNLQP